jgi:adenylyltransferase/sulfurtransferase
VGKLGISDGDAVDLSNLQRQILYDEADIGRPKAETAAEKVRAMNPGVQVVVHDEPIAVDNALETIRNYDVVVDATDSFASRYVLNDACILLDRPFVHGSVYRFEGQLSVLGVDDGPCYRCIFPEPPSSGEIPSAAEVGILGVVPGVIGVMQAAETLKLLLGIGDSVVGRLVLYDALAADVQEVRVRKNKSCPICGESPSITELKCDEKLYSDQKKESG